MANTDIKTGFKPLNVKDAVLYRDLLTTGETTKDGDILYRASTGLLTATASTNKIAGVQAGAILDESDGFINTTSVDGDMVMIYANPDEVFVGQITTFAQTDPYTTRVSSACFDVAGSAGAQYIDAGATTLDTFKVQRVTAEYDTGALSAVGAYAKVECTINPDKHEKTALT